MNDKAASPRVRKVTAHVPGTVRAGRWHGNGDVRTCRPPHGWCVIAELTDVHPITGRCLSREVWWIIEMKE